MYRKTSNAAFTLIEMLTVMAVIAILAGLILSINGLVRKKSATARAETEIKALSAACESYKADNGTYPRDTATDALDPKTKGIPTTVEYKSASLSLYKALSGDTNANRKADAGEGTNYAQEFFRPDRLGGTSPAVDFLKDPFGESYGYSTANYADVSATPPVNPARGYNPTFDLWSTAGKRTDPVPVELGTTRDITNTWVTNW